MERAPCGADASTPRPLPPANCVVAMKKRFEELQLTGRLPSPSAIGVRILQLLRDDDYDAAELARIIQTDPALAGRILKMANSVRLGGARPITAVTDAVVRLGLNTVRNLALGFSLLSTHRNGRCHAFDYSRYWSESLARAIAAQALAGELRIVAPNEAYICGLLAGVGRLALATVHPESYSGILSRTGDEAPIELADAEQTAFAIDHGEVTYSMMRDWQIPEMLCSAAADYWRSPRYDQPLPPELQALHNLVRLAATIAAILVEAPTQAAAHWPLVESLARRLGLALDEMPGLCDRIARQWHEWLAMLGFEGRPPESFQVVREQAAQRLDTPSDEASAIDALDPQPGPGVAEPEAENRLPSVLVAIPDPTRTSQIAEWLLAARFDVITSPDRDGVLAATLDRAPDILIIDEAMAGGYGPDIARELRISENGRNLHILLLVDPRGADPAQIVQDGVDEMVARDCCEQVLLARLQLGMKLTALRRDLAVSQARRRHLQARLARLQRQIETATATDPLTRVRSQTYAIERLGQVWSQGPTSPLSLAMFAVDGMRQTNLTYGRGHGDQLLVEIARVLTGQKRAADLLCRLGGAMFAVLCRADATGVAIMAERYRGAIDRAVFSVAHAAGKVTLSVGLATRAEWMTRPGDLLRCAEQAIQDAIQHGGDRVVSARDTAHQTIDDHG